MRNDEGGLAAPFFSSLEAAGGRVVLDSNAVLALWMFADPALAALRAAVDRREVTAVVCDSTLEELRRVLAYPRFGLAQEHQAQLLNDYVARAERVDAPALAPGALPACRDPDDQKFLALAWDSGVPLLTRDKALLRLRRHREVRLRTLILRPEDADRLLAQR